MNTVFGMNRYVLSKYKFAPPPPERFKEHVVETYHTLGLGSLKKQQKRRFVLSFECKRMVRCGAHWKAFINMHLQNSFIHP